MMALAMKPVFSRTVFFSLMASLAALPLAAQQDGEISSRENARRQAATRDAMQQVQEARTAYSAKKYSDAVEHYRNALAVLPDAPATAKQRTFIKDSLSDALIAKGMDYRTVGRYEEAIAFFKEASELSPNNARAKHELLRTQDPIRHNPSLTPKHLAEVEEVQRLLELGYGDLDLGNYDKALGSFKSVLELDPYNTAAVRGMEAAQKRRHDFFEAGHDAYRSEALAEVDSKWVSEDVTAARDNMDQTAVVSQTEAGVVSEDPEVENRIAAALREMKLTQISFEDATITEVVDALQAQVRRQESNGVSAGRPINITANFGAPDTDVYKRIMGKTVRLILNDVSVMEVLELVCKQMGITYYVSPIGLELSYSGRDFGPMVERIYTVPPHFFDQDEEEEENEDDDFQSARMSVRRVNPMAALKGMGISFPEGASARYSASTRQLRVVNTAFNQEEIAELINTPLDARDRSVVLNVIAMEVAETDLDALGFEWLLNFDVSPHKMFAGGAVTTDVPGQRPAGSDLPTQSGSMTEGLRSMDGILASGNNIDRLISAGSAYNYGQQLKGEAKMPGIFSLRGVWQQADVSVIMRGLSQKKGTDILYNPRLVLTPGMEEQVTFANVREMYYPESYDAPQIQSAFLNFRNGDDGEDGAAGQTTFAAGAHPSEFTRFGMDSDTVGGIGSIVQVHSADVSPDGQFVTLALTTTINEFEGFINWGSPIQSVLWRRRDRERPTEIVLTDNKTLKPVFKRRMENTKITVAPGSVLVMGGLKQAQTVRFEDKLPILGDLPLIGRLFRSSGEETQRKAFLLFAKVDLVDPTGKDPRSGERPNEDTLNIS